jgi:NAD(P)-dependent dehydrogenase (short-subunit alcohol dehydrogenase family)
MSSTDPTVSSRPSGAPGEDQVNDKVLTGKSALITGASQGIGLASARALAQDGATVVVMGRDRQRLESARDQLRAEFPATRVEIFAGDGVREQDVKSALARFARARLSIANSSLIIILPASRFADHVRCGLFLFNRKGRRFGTIGS